MEKSNISREKMANAAGICQLCEAVFNKIKEFSNYATTPTERAALLCCPQCMLFASISARRISTTTRPQFEIVGDRKECCLCRMRMMEKNRPELANLAKCEVCEECIEELKEDESNQTQHDQ